MNEPKSNTTSATRSLKELWTEWKAVVALFACRDIARFHVNPDFYQKLHQNLLEACDEGHHTKPDPVSQMIAELARSWASFESLNKAPIKILKDLRAKCEIADREINGLHWEPKSLPSAAVALFAVIFILTLLILIIPELKGYLGLREFLRWSTFQAQYLQAELLDTLKGRVHFRAAVAIGVTTAVFLAFFAFRSARSP